MSAVLDGLIEAAHRRARDLVPAAPLSRAERPSLAAALAGRDRLSVIAEFKRRSPSAGPLARGVDLAQRVRAYERGGAAAISVLTEPTGFGGSAADLRRARGVTGLPILMKDFVVAPSQVEEAAHLGASAVLLIARCLAPSTLEDLAAAAGELEVEVLIECADEAELDLALAVPGALIGVNNRDLSTFEVDLARSRDLLARVPRDRVAVAESGFSRPRDTAEVCRVADAVLIGSALMRSEDPAAFLREVAP